ncbi:STAS domain-containing protein [Dactylosporangium sp. NPDC051484]|uniref:STAS domain-containing protein n=1 Tax=Dactylosporangium sp. NPDC051484 TaxID=3154942 RepID=UPI00344E23A3
MTAVRAAPTVVVDLARLTFLDSSGVHALVTAHRTAPQRAGRLNVGDAGGMVAQVLKVSGVGERQQPRNGGCDD